MSKVAQWQYTASDNDIQSMNVLPSNLMMWKAYDPLCRYRGSSPLLPCPYAVDQLFDYDVTFRSGWLTDKGLAFWHNFIADMDQDIA